MANRRDGEWHKCDALGNAYRVQGTAVLTAPLLTNGDIDENATGELDFFRGLDDQEKVMAFLDGEQTCPRCHNKYERESIDGGRCVVCGTMICAEGSDLT